MPGPLVACQDVRVRIEGERLARMAELRRHQRHRDTPGDLHARISVPQIVRVAVKDPGSLARGWRLARVDVPGEGDEPLLAAYCPECAEREFGLRRRMGSGQADAQ
jgi:hypothetical protein